MKKNTGLLVKASRPVFSLINPVRQMPCLFLKNFLMTICLSFCIGGRFPQRTFNHYHNGGLLHKCFMKFLFPGRRLKLKYFVFGKNTV